MRLGPDVNKPNKSRSKSMYNTRLPADMQNIIDNWNDKPVD